MPRVFGKPSAMKLLQQAIFLPAHPRRAAGSVMVKSMKMQYPVDQKAVNGHVERDLIFFRLTEGFVDRDDNITYVIEFKGGREISRVRPGRPRGKGEHVGRLINIPEAPVERAHGPAAYNGDIERGIT